VQSVLTLLLYSAHQCCSVDSQGQGKAQRFASQVQHWAFLASQLNTMSWLTWHVRLPCLSYLGNPRSSSTFGDSFRQKSVSFYCLELWSANITYLCCWLSYLLILNRAVHGQHMVNPLLKLEVYSTGVKGCWKTLGCQIVVDMLYFPSW